VARSLWRERAATLVLLDPALSSKNQFFFFPRTGTARPKPPIRHPFRMVWVVQPPHPSSVADGMGKWS
jgi:hypothetical protein